MSLCGSISKHTFTFRFNARTSRGPMKEKTSWFIRIWDEDDPTCAGIGECGPLPGLSKEATPELEKVLAKCIGHISTITELSEENIFEIVRKIVPDGFPSIVFAVETALLDLANGGKRIIFNNSFLQGKPIPINGLVWMGDEHFMKQQVDDKIAQGFRCIKLKVGALDFDTECRILEYIRAKYDNEITLRLDANGAFSIDDVLLKLKVLSAFSIHSIEQPIKAGQDEMEMVCRKSPIPVALDEELIGNEGDKQKLLEGIQPQYIILKPTLHGGLHHCRLWIAEAEKLNIGWWITSALESNIGLNAICQFTGNYNDTGLFHGLGTGTLYTNNIPSPLKADSGTIRYDQAALWGDIEV